MNFARWTPAGWWIAAALSPPLALAVAIALNLPADAWRDLSRSTLQSLMPDAFLYSTWALIVGAPLIGVVRRSQPWPLLVAVALFVGASATIHVAVFGARGESLLRLAASHTTVAAAATALVAWGALAGAMFRDRLDAAGVALTVTLLLSGGVLVAGAPVADAPRLLIEAVLMASPIVAMAAAAGIDIARSEVLYQLSPLARLHFEYPTWYSASALYFGAACALSIAAWRMLRAIDSCPHLKGLSWPSRRES